MQIQFVHPWVLVLLWLVPVVGLLWLAACRLKAQALARFLSPEMGSKLAPPPQLFRFYWQWALCLLGLLLALIAAARPQWGQRTETVRQRGRDLIIALDVSRSMLAQDVHPNRLQRAKTDIQDLLRELRGDRVALIAFRGKGLQLCPLTTDYAYLEQVLADVSPESAPRGETDIGDAIDKALAAFESDVGAYQAIILISDGEDLAGNAKARAEVARKKGVAIFTVGLGDPQGAKIPSAGQRGEFITYRGQEVVSKLQHETLKSIAEITGGAYVPVGTANVKLGALYRDHLSHLAARDLAESIQRRYVERYQFFLLPAVLAFLAGALLSKGRLGVGKKSPVQSDRITLRKVWPDHSAGATQAKAGLVALILALAVGAPLRTVFAATSKPEASPPEPTNLTSAATAVTNSMPVKSRAVGRAGARHAQKLYWLGKYQEAADAYLQAQKDQTPALQNDCLFNAGCALYRSGQYQAAAEKFSALTEHAADNTAASYNLGCALFQSASQGQATNQPPAMRPTTLERAGEAFQRALRSDTHDETARANLSVVTNLLPEVRQQAKISALLARYQGTPPGQLADLMLVNQRSLNNSLRPALTNNTPARIGQLESLNKQEEANTDLLIPLKAKLAEGPAAGAGGAAAAPQVAQHLEALRTTMQQTAEYLRDLEPEALSLAQTAEGGIYHLWKGLADFPQLLREDLFRQTNSIALTASVLASAAPAELPAINFEQSEAQALTGQFIKRFSSAVPPGGTASETSGAPPKAVTNAPAERQEITAEMRTNILALASRALALQGQALKSIAATNLTAALPDQRRAYHILEEIAKLLPREKKDQQQQPRQEEEQPEPSPQDQQQQQQQQPPQQQEPQEQPKESEEKVPPPPEKQPEPQKEKEMTPEQARALLEKAQQRDKEHREERRRDTYLSPAPVDRDW